jgi:hypothetical protein
MNQRRHKQGIQKLLARGRRIFRSEENRCCYSETDFKAAERKFLKECIIKDRCRT